MKNFISKSYISGECIGSRLKQRFRLEGRGHPLVLVHGVGVCLEDQERLAEELRRDFRVLRYDLRGHGGSERLPGPYSLQDFSDDLRELIDEIGFEYADFMGFSLGGLILQRFALDYPDRVRRLGLISTITGRTSDERAAALRRADTLASGGPGAHLTQSVGRWFTEDFQRRNPEIVEGRKTRIAANHLPSYAAAYRVLAEYDLAEELHKISHRTLVVTGEFDQGSNPRMSHLMADRILNSELHILSGLRHALAVEAPQQLAQVIRNFLLHP